MARKTKTATAPQNTALDRAHTIAEKAGDQIRTLLGRNWREISEILDDADTGNEIKLACSITITDRVSAPGEHGEKDNRVKSSMSFAVKTSDSIESEIPDPNQMELTVVTSEEPQPE